MTETNTKRVNYSKLYIDYVNNFLTVANFANHYDITHDEALYIIRLGRKIDDLLCHLSDRYSQCKNCGQILLSLSSPSLGIWKHSCKGSSSPSPKQIEKQITQEMFNLNLIKDGKSYAGLFSYINQQGITIFDYINSLKFNNAL